MKSVNDWPRKPLRKLETLHRVTLLQSMHDNACVEAIHGERSYVHSCLPR